MTKNLVPNYKTQVKFGMFNAIVEIENTFLQKLVSMGGMIIQKRDYFNLYAGEALAMLKVREDHIYIECLATLVTVRRQGHGKKAMQALCYAADHTNTILKLETSNVRVNRGIAIIPPAPIMIGSVTKNKIPVAKLKDFYMKFGFVVDGKGKKQHNYLMSYSPKPIANEIN